MSFSKRSTARPGELRWKRLCDWRTFKKQIEPLPSMKLYEKASNVPPETGAGWVEIYNKMTTTVSSTLRHRRVLGLQMAPRGWRHHPPSLPRSLEIPPTSCQSHDLHWNFEASEAFEEEWQKLYRTEAIERYEAKQFKQRCNAMKIHENLMKSIQASCAVI